MDGFYAVYYTGKTGSGFAIVVFKNGIITGADVSGGLYDGHYKIDSEKQALTGTITMTVAPGASLVTGAPIGQVPYTQEFPISLSLGAEQHQPIQVRIPTGLVNLNLKKLRDFPA